VKFGKGVIAGDEVDFSDQNFTFAAATSDTTVDIAEVVRLSGTHPRVPLCVWFPIMSV